MMDRPSAFPEWALTASAPDITEPPGTKKNAGWLYAEEPPYQFMNWLQNLAGEWSKYFDAAMPPIGSVIPHYDFNGAFTFDAEHWAYCNGQTIVAPGDPMDGKTLEDLSNRYLVGFGTEGGGDVGSAAWATGAVGIANHQVNLSHSHTVNSHAHTVNSHSHSDGSLQFNIGTMDTTPIFKMSTNGSSANQQVSEHLTFNGGPVQAGTGYSWSHIRSNLWQANLTFKTYGGSGNTGTASPGTDSQAPGTDSQLSGSQSIQPRSIRVRYIMRIK